MLSLSNFTVPQLNNQALFLIAHAISRPWYLVTVHRAQFPQTAAVVKVPYLNSAISRPCHQSALGWVKCHCCYLGAVVSIRELYDLLACLQAPHAHDRVVTSTDDLEQKLTSSDCGFVF